MARFDRPAFQGHHVIEQQAFAGSELLTRLADDQLFELHGDRNLLNLPADKRLAMQLQTSPHTGGPLRSYSDGLFEALSELELSPDGRAYLVDGDAAAGARLSARVGALTDTLKVALVRGDVLTNTPVGLDPAAANARNASFFRDIDAYAQVHAREISAIGHLTGPEARWQPSLQSDRTLAQSADAIDRPGTKALNGDALAGNRSLLDAADQAQSAGRLQLSEQVRIEIEQRLTTPRAQRGAIAPELLAGELSSARVLRAGGLLATGADGLLSATRAADMADRGNLMGAESEALHFAGRTLGGWGGGALTAYALGTAGAGPMALVAADGYFLVKAGEKAADLWDDHRIYHQTDRHGVAWTFDGRGWAKDASVDSSVDGVNNPKASPIYASLDTTRELDYKATNTALGIAMRHAPDPQDPFRLPAGPHDRPSLNDAPWVHDAATGTWHRTIKVAVSGADDRGIYEQETASAQRALQLNAQSQEVIARNIANSPEAMAARYELAYVDNRFDRAGPMPAAAVGNQPNPDVLRASDGNTYRRTDQGTWDRNGVPAVGNVALELEQTRQQWQTELSQHRQLIAALEQRPAPTVDELRHEQTQFRYRLSGNRIEPEWQQAVELAVDRTRQSAGLKGESVVQLKPNAEGQYRVDSPIAHLQRGVDGAYHVVATTSTEEIRAALDEVRGHTRSGAPVPAVAGVGGASRPPRDDEQEARSHATHPASGPVLADNPAHPDFATFNRIHEWTRSIGQWDEAGSRNVAAALYKQQAADPLVKRVDEVVGGLGRDGAQNVFAVFKPFGEQQPMFQAHVDGRVASQQPAQENLQQAEQIQQQAQQQQQTLEQTQQQARPAHTLAR